MNPRLLKKPGKQNPDKFYLLNRLMRKEEEVDPMRSRLNKPFTKFQNEKRRI
jgi:hypothetical protein